MLRKIIVHSAIIISAIFSADAISPSDSSATQETKTLYTYLINISGQKILSGQESMYSDELIQGAFPSKRDTFVYNRTGKYPAVYASDFGDFNTNLADRKYVVQNAIAYHKKGSVIAIQYHMVQPNGDETKGFDAMHIPGSTYTGLDSILTEGSDYNKTFKGRLDTLAGYFKTLQDSGVAIIWRPYHEMNGDWFWWSYQDKYKDLWIYTWNYLTKTKNCHNLLWVFSVNYYPKGASGKVSPSFYYPGNQYVDILGCDIYQGYGHSFSKYIHDDLRTLGNKKPIAITENGTMPDIATLLQEQPFWVYWLTWWGFEGVDANVKSENTNDLYTKNYTNPAVLTQDEVFNTAIDTNLRIVSMSAEGSGTVNRTPNTPTVSSGTSVTFTATPASGWEFTGWSSSLVSTENPLTITVTDHINLVATFKPLAGTVVNLIQNGDFSEDLTSGWNPLLVMEGGAATSEIVNGELVFTITNGGTLAWSVQLTQSAIKLEQGKTYTLSFKAHATAAKDIFVKIGQSAGSYTQYGGGNFSITTIPQTFATTFSMTAATDSGARVEFNVGLNTTTLYLDDMSLVEGNGTPVVINKNAKINNKNLNVLLCADGLHYDFKSGSNDKNKITLFRLDGAKVISANGNSGIIDRKMLSPGLYTIRATNGTTIWSRNITVF
jgi:beta-mannanase